MADWMARSSSAGLAPARPAPDGSTPGQANPTDRLGTPAGRPGRASRGRSFRSLPKPVRVAAAIVAVGLFVSLGYVGYTRAFATPVKVATPATFAVKRDTLTTTVSTSGTVAALSQAKVAFTSAGRVDEVNVKIGDTVTKGQALAKLSTTDLALTVSQQKAALSSAQAKLAALKDGSRAEDIAAAKAQVDAANAKLAAMQAGGRAEDVTSAQAGITSARAKLAQLTAPATDSDVKAAEQTVVAAQASVQTAQTALDKLKAGSVSEDVKAAQLALEQAKDSLWANQISRDATCGRDKGTQCQAADASVAASEVGVQTAQNSLAKVLKPATAQDVSSAQKNLDSAKASLAAASAKLAQTKAGSNSNDILAAQASLTQAEQALALKLKPNTDADIQAQKQAIAAAEASLAKLVQPNTASDLAQAQAAVDQAQAALDSAQYALSNGTLDSPFDGVVNAVGYNVGEAAGSSNIAVVNPKDVRLDVNVGESDIARLQVGQPAAITFDAISGQTFVGQVTGIAPNATISSGVATYTVSVGITDPGVVKPGMTGNAVITTSKQDNVLVVPNKTISTQGQTKVVKVLAGDQVLTRPVTIGLSGDTYTEVKSGLVEGDKVVVVTTTTAASSNRAGGGGIMGGSGGPPPGG